MKTYNVHYPIHHDKPEPYVPGEKIKLTEQEAAPLLHARVISLPGEPAVETVTAIDFGPMTKQQIADTAKDKLGLELAMTLSKEEMLAKVKEVQTKASAS